MSLINKNVAAAFGYAVFGRAVFGLDFSSQNIPSELYDEAKNIGVVARPDAIVSKRAPFKIDQPGTPEQQVVWDIFLKATKCFAKQPEAGGAVPPAIGPRNRSWWYDNDPGIDPIYYNYFMKETLTLLHQGITPNWCKTPIIGDSYVNALGPDVNYNADPRLFVAIEEIFGPDRINRTFIKVPSGFHKRLYLFIVLTSTSGMGQRTMEVRVVDPDAWDEETITWNNQPALGAQIAILYPPFTVSTWRDFSIGLFPSVCIKLIDENPPPPNAYANVVFGARSAPTPEHQPFYQIED